MSFVAGLLSGAFGGLFGVGGGIIMIPMMVALMSTSQVVAHGTSLGAIVFIGAIGAATYALQGAVDLTASLLLAATSIPFALTGARYANSMREWKLKRAFGAFLLAAAAMLLMKPFIFSATSAAAASTMSKTVVLMLAGILAGFLAGLLGVGGGAIMIPAMVLFVGLDQHTAQGSSLLVMVPTGLVGAWTHLRLGSINTGILKGMVPGVLLGTLVGGSVAQSLPENVLRFIFCAMLLWTAVRFLRASPDA